MATHSSILALKIPWTGVFPELGTASDAAFFVGPEGGFTVAETDAMFAAGALPLRIGDWTLRVETAAVAGLGVLNVLGGQVLH